MERIRVLAVLSVRRACAFAALAIVTVMFALVADPLLSLRSGAILTTFAAAVLYWRGLQAPRRNHRHTELWILLDGATNPPDSHMGRVINNTLREVYLWHAERAAIIAALLWLLVFVSRILA